MPEPSLRPSRPCPLCKKPSRQKFHPFCSARCAQIDLGKWLGEGYRIPVKEQPDADDEDA